MVAFELSHSTIIAFISAGVALPFPLLLALNWSDEIKLGFWLKIGKAVGNLGAITLFFTHLTLFFGLAVSSKGYDDIWATVPAGFMTMVLAAFVFPDNISHYLMILLRSIGHFFLFFFLAFLAAKPLIEYIPNPIEFPFYVAGVCTFFSAIALYLDSRETTSSNPEQATHWSILFVVLVVLFGLPVWCIVWIWGAWLQASDAVQMIHEIFNKFR